MYLKFILPVLALLALGGCMNPIPPDPSPVVELTAAGAKDADVILDVRPREAVEKGHVAGAVWVDIASWVAAAKDPATSLENGDYWRARLGALGVSPGTRVVVYDDGRMTEAARVWFILQHFGVANVAVVNGGMKAIAPAGLATGMPATPTTRPFTAIVPGRVGYVGREELAADLRKGGGAAKVFDARTPAEYAGTDKRKNPRGGHLPEAVNIPHADLLTADGRLKSKDELTRLFLRAGLKPGDRIVTHCESGGRASLAALAIVYAGFGKVDNYYLSFSDWSAADPTACPVVAPAK